jgi:hypothetical protein
MAVQSVVDIGINFTGDVEYGQTFQGPAANASSPGMVETKTLSSGANTITVPSGAVGVTLVPPVNNAVTMTLKGITGDTGIALSLVNPAHISLSGVSTFVITAGGTISNFRLIWS